MSVTASSTEAMRSRRRHVLDNGTVYWKRVFIPPDPGGDGPRPNCFLVEQEPNSEIAPHFHQANQFQVFVAGAGTLGKHAIAPLTVYYTNAHTPYGPIRSGDAGLHYFTLRDDFDPGARFMPGARAELRPTSRRTATSAPFTAPDAGRLGETARHAIIGPDEDGLGAWMISAPPHAPVGLRDPAGDGMRFLMVVAGSVVDGAAALPPRSCVYVPPDETPALTAGAEGLFLLVLRFARAIEPSPPDASRPASH